MAPGSAARPKSLRWNAGGGRQSLAHKDQDPTSIEPSWDDPTIAMVGMHCKQTNIIEPMANTAGHKTNTVGGGGTKKL